MNLDTSVQETIIARFRETFGEQLKLNVPLARYTSARVGGPADLFLTVRSSEELQTAVELAHQLHLPYFILGGGSNILIADSGIRGLVIMNRAKAVRFRHSGAGVICTVESGMNLSSLARQCISKGLGGLEWAIGVPGTVGGAVVGNAGAHGGDMSDNVRTVTVWEPGRGVRIYANEEMEYGYRDSILKQEQEKYKPRRVVLSTDLLLQPEPISVLTARAVSAICVAGRCVSHGGRVRAFARAGDPVAALDRL